MRVQHFFMYFHSKMNKPYEKRKLAVMLKPMLLTDSRDIPIGDDWLYETKYDGYRCLLTWEKGATTPILTSRNNNELNEKFPEIIAFCMSIQKDVKPYLPLTFDGEIVYLENHFQSNFSVVQKRGKLRNASKIEEQSTKFPCHYVIFDVIQLNGQPQTNADLVTRKQLLKKLSTSLGFPASVNYTSFHRLQVIDVFEEHETLWNKVKMYNGEGMIAKKRNSRWVEGSRTKEWLKIKNWRYVNVILMKYDASNGYFEGAVYKGDMLIDVVTFKHGLTAEEAATLATLFKQNGTVHKNGVLELPPSICITIACIDFDGEKLREPKFHAFQHQLDPTECTWQNFLRQLQPIPEQVTVTHPEKPVFPASHVTKDDYLLYLQKVAPNLLPFLHNRLLTVIRYPHGVPGESFYQKNSPDNTPNFVETHFLEDTNFILCNELDTLLWLGNQLAIEFHIPFQPVHLHKPTEIVFDLDPPSVDEFQLAVSAALKMKTIFDHFGLTSFVKTSGGKGMQIYIPLPEQAFTYKQTGRFAEFVCHFLVQQYPDFFTTERLKKKRGNKLYLDYVQFKEGKTIIAPYSVRGNEKGLVATPLYWEEVNEQLRPDLFTMANVIERLQHVGDPFKGFREAGEKQGFASVLSQLEGLQN